MIKTFCDVCDKEAKTEEHLLRIKEVTLGSSIGSVYMCSECTKKYLWLEKEFDKAFVQNKGKIKITKE